MKGKAKKPMVLPRNYLVIPVIALALIIITAGSAFAHEGKSGESRSDRPGFEQRTEKHKEIKNAVANADFEAFQSAIADMPEKDGREVDEESFARLVEVHALHEAGEHEEARAVMEELGFKPKFKHHKRGERKGHLKEKFGELDDEKAEILRQAHELREAGDKEGAKALFKQLRN